MLHDITVLTIDEKVGSVRIDNNGQPETLTFKENGAKLTPGPAVPAPGAVPAGMPGGIPRPGMPGGLPMRPGMPGIPIPSSAGGTIPTAVNSAGAAAGTIAGLASGATPMPTRNMREAAPLTAEESAILLEVERDRTKDSVALGLLPPLPPPTAGMKQLLDPQGNTQPSQSPTAFPLPGRRSLSTLPGQ